MEKQVKDLYRTVYECFSTLQIAIEKAHESSQGKINLLEEKQELTDEVVTKIEACIKDFKSGYKPIESQM